MAKLRCYYNKAGKIVQVEHRPDENYTNENLARQEADLQSVIIGSEELEGQVIDDLEVKRGKLVKPKPAQ